MKTHGRMALLITISVVLAGRYALSQGGTLGGPPTRNPDDRGRGVDPITTLRQPSLPRNVSQVGEGVFLITDGRPLELAAQLLSRKLGITVSFEEAAWMSSRDVVRAADLPGNEGVTSRNHPRGPLVPRNSTLTLVVPTTKAAQEAAGPARILQTVLDSHSSSKNPGNYRLVRVSESEYSITVAEVEDESGKKLKQVSPLDVRISFPEKDRTFQETLDLIYQSVSAAAHVELGDLMKYERAMRVQLGANNEVARQVLAKALRRPGGKKLAWFLRYDPEYKFYLIYFQGVEAEEFLPGLGVRLLPLVWQKP